MDSTSLLAGWSWKYEIPDRSVRHSGHCALWSSARCRHFTQNVCRSVSGGLY